MLYWTFIKRSSPPLCATVFPSSVPIICSYYSDRNKITEGHRERLLVLIQAPTTTNGPVSTLLERITGRARVTQNVKMFRRAPENHLISLCFTISLQLSCKLENLLYIILFSQRKLGFRVGRHESCPYCQVVLGFIILKEKHYVIITH